MSYYDLPIGDNAPDVFNVVVEIPKGSENKYEYDPDLHIFRLDRTLYSPMHYPGDYGFIPSTMGGDDDPLDVLVLVESPTFTGCVIEARSVGMLVMLDQGFEDQKLLCVSTKDPRQETVKNYDDVHPHRSEKSSTSLVSTRSSKENGLNGGWRNAAEAREVIIAGRERFLSKHQ